MVKKILILFLLVFNYQVFSQCAEINSFIQDNYLIDAKVLALREIQNNIEDPDYDNPYVTQERYMPYLHKFSALYNTLATDENASKIFNELKIHANLEYNDAKIFPKEITLSVRPDVSWVDSFIETGISGNSVLDELIETYKLNIVSNITRNNVVNITLKTEEELLNLKALEDDFQQISDIESAFALETNISERFNYTGDTYTISSPSSSANTEVVDILVEGDEFKFMVYGGDCMAGCGLSETIATYTIDTNCRILSNIKFNVFNFSFQPNPARDIVVLKTNRDVSIIELYAITGKKVLTQKGNIKTLDVSNLNSGMYLVKVTAKQETIIKKLVKQ